MNVTVLWAAIGGFWCGAVFAIRFVQTEVLHAEEPEKRRFRELTWLVLLAHLSAVALTIAEVL